MVKSISAGLDTHFAQTVTTIATCWIITRTDRVIFRFTTHVTDLEDVDFGIGDGAQTYLASSGYRRSNIQNDAEMNVNNMEVQGVFDNEAIKELDLRRGLFDFAEVRIFFFNYEDTSQGVLKMLRGFLGEVVATPDGAFGVELRSMEQVLTKTFAEFYSKDCRADLGDARCRIPLSPDEVTRLTAYVADDFVQVNNARFTALALTNPGAETGDTTGWTNDLGSLAVRSADPIPLLGSFYFFGGASAETRSRQDVTVPGGQEALVDAGNAKATLTWHQTSFAGSDTGEMEIEFFDGGLGSLGARVGAGLVAPTGQIWTPRLLSLDIPALTRTIRIFIHADRNAGGNNDAYFDEINLNLEDVSVQFNSAFDERIYRVVTAGTTGLVQPPYNDVAEVPATGILTLTANAANLETVTIDTKVYTFQTGLTNVDGNVFIGATASDSIDNLIAAINLGVGAGFLYATATTLHPTVKAAAGLGDTVDATAKVRGTGGNSIATTEGLANGSWGNATLSGGAAGQITFDGGFQANGVLTLAANAGEGETVTIDAKVYTFNATVGTADGDVHIGATASDSLDNLIAAINLAGGDPTDYASAMTLHPTVTASAGNGDTMVAQANDPGTAGNLIDTTEGMASGSWRSVTLINGTDGAVFIAEEAWTRIAIVSAVDGTEPRRKFTVTELTPSVGGPRGGFPDGWFNFGGLTFETGLNAGRTMEVRVFTADDGITITQDIELFLDMPFDVAVSDRFTTYPGCDKLLATCRDKFDNVINFVGEPVVPGADYIRQYPDAQ